MDADGWFDWWVSVYVKETGSPAEVADLLVENQEVILGHWRATRAELDECADRLIRDGRVPRWLNEHTNALHRELKALREEAARVARAAAPVPADCPACGGSGLAVVPLRACVWEGRLVLHPDFRRVVTGAVVCDRPGCVAGERQQLAERCRKTDRPRPTLSAQERLCRADLVRLLAGFDRDRARRARGSGSGDNALSQEFGNLLRIVQEGGAGGGPGGAFSDAGGDTGSR